MAQWRSQKFSTGGASIQDGGRPIHLRPALRRREILQFVVSIFKMAAARHFAVLKLKFLTANHFRDTFCIVKSDFVEVGRTVAEMSHFFRIFSEM